MTDLVKNSTAGHAIALLNHYSFDLEGYSAEQFVQQWASNYQSRWVRAAVIEALYQGRYKAVSVGQILAFWQRRGEPLCHFNYEFERIICSSSPQNLTTQTIPERLEIAARQAEKRQDPPPIVIPPVSVPVSAPAEVAAVQALPVGFGPVSNSSAANLPENQPASAANPDPADLPALPLPPELTIPPVSSPAITPDASSIQESSKDLPSDQLQPASIRAEAEAAPVSQPTVSPVVEDSDLPLRVFQPSQEEEPYDVYQANWSRSDAGKYPIHQFVPTSETSEFHEKLKSVSQQVKR